MERLGIYIHIPFCKQKCKYCDFVSFYKEENVQEQYIKSLIKEIKEKELENLTIHQEKRKVTTIYIGGGTPSLIDSKYIVQILDTIKEKFVVTKESEITIEINPGTITKEKLINYKKSRNKSYKHWTSIC